jgi:hypothetical protein
MLIALLLLLGFAEAPAGRLHAWVHVDSPSEILRLESLGALLEDARILTKTDAQNIVRQRVRWNAENQFVVVSGSSDLINRLPEAGFEVMKVQPAPGAPPLPAPEGLDTIPYQFGWPRAIFNGLSLYENSPVVADMNLDGQLEVSVTNAWGSYNPTNPPVVIAWRRNGAYLSGFPVALQPGVMQSSADAGIAAVGDIHGDAKPEILCGDENGFLYAFASNGAPLPGFPLPYGNFVGVFTPAIADVDNDGKGEFAFITHDWDFPYGNAWLHLMKMGDTGPAEMPGFPVPLERGAENSPSIGDLDGDGDFEIVAATGSEQSAGVMAKLIVHEALGGAPVAGFPWVIGRNTAGNSPTLWDLNNDGTLEILIRVKPDSTDINGIYALDHLGRILPGFPFPVLYGNSSSCVAVGDMTGDGIPELAYGGVEAVDSGKVYAYFLNGQALPGFPARVYRTFVDGAVTIADVSGDGIGDVIATTNGVSNKPGVVRAFNNQGQEIPGFPLMPGNPILNSFHCHPTVVDIDGDGDTEIFAGRMDMFVYAWDTPGQFDSLHAWRMFKGNAARTGGQLRSPFAVSVEQREPLPGAFALLQAYPNPFNPAVRWQVRTDRRMRVRAVVHDVLGREVAELLDGDLSAGLHVLPFDATGLAGGVYFCRVTAVADGGGSVQTAVRSAVLVK